MSLRSSIISKRESIGGGNVDLEKEIDDQAGKKNVSMDVLIAKICEMTEEEEACNAKTSGFF